MMTKQEGEKLCRLSAALKRCHVCFLVLSRNLMFDFLLLVTQRIRNLFLFFLFTFLSYLYRKIFVTLRETAK